MQYALRQQGSRSTDTVSVRHQSISGSHSKKSRHVFQFRFVVVGIALVTFMLINFHMVLVGRNSALQEFVLTVFDARMPIGTPVSFTYSQIYFFSNCIELPPALFQ